jgi:hypothetical protein
LNSKNKNIKDLYSVSDARQTEVHAAEPLLLGPSCLEVKIAIAELKSINPQAVIKFR